METISPKRNVKNTKQTPPRVNPQPELKKILQMCRRERGAAAEKHVVAEDMLSMRTACVWLCKPKCWAPFRLQTSIAAKNIPCSFKLYIINSELILIM